MPRIFGGLADFVMRGFERRPIASRSTSSSDRSVPRRIVHSPCRAHNCGKSSARSSGSFANTSACSIAFFNSRTFPGQSYDSSSLSAAGSSAASGLPWTGPSRLKKCAPAPEYRRASREAAEQQSPARSAGKKDPRGSARLQRPWADRCSSTPSRARPCAVFPCRPVARTCALRARATVLPAVAGASARHFVEHNRAALRHFEPARLARHRARKRAALVPKKFRFDKFRRKARAINLQEGSIAPRAMLVNPARQLIFAGAALAGISSVVAVSASFSAISRTLCDAGSADIHVIVARSWLRRAAFGVAPCFGWPGSARENQSARRFATVVRDRSIAARFSLKMCTTM